MSLKSLLKSLLFRNRDAFSDVAARLRSIENRLNGAHAVYMGNGRVLTRANFHHLIYLVEADDRLIVPRFVMDGVYEPEVTSFFLEHIRPDSRCVDVGANFGYYTCMMARLAHQGRTIGIEADPRTFELLRDNVYINWLENSGVSLLNVAVSDVAGHLTLYRRVTRSGNTSIIEADHAGAAAMGEAPPEPFTIPSGALDELVSGPVDFLKIDVEGAEPLVFRGMRRLISESPHLRIVMEWAPGQIRDAGFDAAAFTEQLAGYGLSPAVMNHDGTRTSCAWPDVRGRSYCNLLLTRASAGQAWNR